MSDVFAAVGVCGGAFSENDSARAVNPIPFWFVLGTLDDKWLKDYEQSGLVRGIYVAEVRSASDRFLKTVAIQ